MKVKKLLLFILFVFSIIGVYAQSMTDEQVMEFAKQSYSEGLSQQQIANKLLEKGATVEQLKRMKDSYGKGQIIDGTNKIDNNSNRIRTFKSYENNRTSRDEYISKRDTNVNDIVQPEEKKEINKVFGRDVFNNKLLTFEPQLNIATPENYMLGPGDEVIIDIWGASEKTFRQVISPDGTIQIESVGPVYLTGLTMKEANVRIKNVFSEKGYAGIQSGNVFVKLSLGSIRSIQVNVLGEVLTPGTYTVPSLASLFHAIYNAGGVSKIGSMRNVKLFRDGKLVVETDIYDYIFNGTTDKNVILQDGDVIMVSAYQNLVSISGKIKRPMIYEMKKDESVGKLLEYSGGFMGDAYKNNIRIIRKSGKDHQVFMIPSDNFNKFVLTDGDEVSVDSVIDRFENKVEVKGAVFREGIFAINKTTNTIKKLIEEAEGLKGDAFLNRAIIYRERPDYTIEAIPVDLTGIMNGNVDDLELKKNDVLYIPSKFDLREEYTITIKGAVRYPGTYPFINDMTLEDLTLQSGGLLESASSVHVDVARRVKKKRSTDFSEVRAEIFVVDLKEGLMVGGNKEFTLEPFDEVYVRFSPSYQSQQNVYIQGEVKFAGEYTLSLKSQRLSDVVKSAGGLTPEAYPRGARLYRKTTADERLLIQQTLKNIMMNTTSKDSLSTELTSVYSEYSIGIELDKAIANPGSDCDVILKEFDRLVIPEYSGIVKISGAVMYPNSVVYEKSKKMSYYIDQAGGFVQRARKCNMFVIYMNGTIARGRKAKIEPGCEIIVPMKQERRATSLPEILGITSSTASIAAMIATILSVTK
ncbi:MAG: SLBB domain-containing protein [Culturomica sp.]|jgi:protein involved in polysaccharide export with SLBB domain|nr:SLBB domain-containing protein [Culturomica sp.]